MGGLRFGKNPVGMATTKQHEQRFSEALHIPAQHERMQG